MARLRPHDPHLTVALASAGLCISFISTPRNTSRLPKKPSHISSLITFIDLPLPPNDNVPENAEATVDLPLEQIQYLKAAYDSLKKQVKEFLEKESPDWIVRDFLQCWLGENTINVASVPCVFFTVISAAALSFLGPAEALTEEGSRKWWPWPESLIKKPDCVRFDSALAFRPMKAKVFYHGAFNMNASGITDMERLRLTIETCSAVAVRSCNEYEGEHLTLLATY